MNEHINLRRGFFLTLYGRFCDFCEFKTFYDFLWLHENPVLRKELSYVWKM